MHGTRPFLSWSIMIHISYHILSYPIMSYHIALQPRLSTWFSVISPNHASIPHCSHHHSIPFHPQIEHVVPFRPFHFPYASCEWTQPRTMIYGSDSQSDYRAQSSQHTQLRAQVQCECECHAYRRSPFGFAFIFVCDLFGQGLVFYDCGNG